MTKMHGALLMHTFTNSMEAANSCKALQLGLGLDSISTNLNPLLDRLTELDFSIESAYQI